MKQSSSRIRSRYNQLSSFESSCPPVFERISNRSLMAKRREARKKNLRTALYFVPMLVGLSLALALVIPEQEKSRESVLAAVADFDAEYDSPSENSLKLIPDSAIPDMETAEIESSLNMSVLSDELEPQVLVESKAQPELNDSSIKTIKHVVRSGETWGSIVDGYGISRLDALALDKAMRELAKKEKVRRTLAIGQELEFEIEQLSGLTKVSTEVALGARAEFLRSSEGSFVTKLERMTSENRQRVLIGQITADTRTFAAAAREAGVPYDVVDELVDLFSDRVSFRQDVRLGDRFSVVFSEKVLADGTSLGFNKIHSAALNIDGSDYAAVEFVGADGKSRYFDKTGRHIANTFLRYPLKFSRISSQFNKARFHPVLKRRRPHNGVDFAAPTGTPVRSVADGVIVFAGRKGGNGKMVKIQHNSRYATAYLHLSKIAKGVKNGARVLRGQRIGAVGSTGLATGPHLHYSFYDRGRYVDPMKVKLPVMSDLKANQQIDKASLKKALAVLKQYQETELEGAVLTKSMSPEKSPVT